MDAQEYKALQSSKLVAQFCSETCRGVVANIIKIKDESLDDRPTSTLEKYQNAFSKTLAETIDQMGATQIRLQRESDDPIMYKMSANQDYMVKEINKSIEDMHKKLKLEMREMILK